MLQIYNVFSGPIFVKTRVVPGTSTQQDTRYTQHKDKGSEIENTRQEYKSH